MNYRKISTVVQENEHFFNQCQMIVDQRGKDEIRREWERIQEKSHQINNSILRVRSFSSKKMSKRRSIFSLFFLLRSNNNMKLV